MYEVQLCRVAEVSTIVVAVMLIMLVVVVTILQTIISDLQLLVDGIQNAGNILSVIDDLATPQALPFL